MAKRTSDTIWEDTVNPTVTDDSDSGFQVGDQWRNTDTGQVYEASSVTPGAAEWVKFRRWEPMAVTLNDFIPNGVDRFAAEGAGHLNTFNSEADDEMLINIGLNEEALPYDGSEIEIEIHWQLFTAPPPDTNVRWELDYAFIADGEDNYAAVDGTIVLDVNVGGRTERQQYTDIFDLISGPAGSNTLQMTLRRNSTGENADSYPGDADVYGVNMKV